MFGDNVKIGTFSALMLAGLAAASLTFHSAHAQTAAQPQGSFSFSEQGTIGNQALAGVGVITLDGKGVATGSETLQVGGVAVTTKFQGTYSMGTDGSGQLTLIHDLGNDNGDTLTANYRLVSSDGGKTFHAVRTDAGVVVVNTIERQ